MWRVESVKYKADALSGSGHTGNTYPLNRISVQITLMATELTVSWKTKASSIECIEPFSETPSIEAQDSVSSHFVCV